MPTIGGSRSKRIIALLCLIVGILAPPFTAGAVEALSPSQKLTFDIYKELIEIDTTTATGDTARAADAMARRLRDAGFPEADVQVFSPVPKKGNLVARLRGTGALRPMLLLAHIDVVPARRED
jgi:acetylornithine deacetylase/succinyl-diaminopimelate desuccinylase-like protein